MKTNIGAERGRRIRVKTCHFVAPSTMAASSRLGLMLSR